MEESFLSRGMLVKDFIQSKYMFTHYGPIWITALDKFLKSVEKARTKRDSFEEVKLDETGVREGRVDM